MGFFDFLKKKSTTKSQPIKKTTKDGELPSGWLYQNKEFLGKIQDEYTYFLNMWVDSRHKSPKEHYSSLKSFVLYLEDVEKLCKSKGKRFEFWFYEILTSKNYITKRKKELEDLTTNFDEIQSNYNKRSKELSNLDDKIIKALIEHPNILQTDFVKLFDSVVQPDVREKLYYMEKAGDLKRTKSGRSYILKYKK